MEHVSDEQVLPPNVVDNLGIHIKRRGKDNIDGEFATNYAISIERLTFQLQKQGRFKHLLWN